MPPPTRYHQAADQILAFIEAHGLGPGRRLPSEPELAAQLGVSRTTVREAIRLLEYRGALVSRHGSGTYVAERLERLQASFDELHSITELIRSQGQKPGTAGLEISEAPLPAQAAEALGLAEGERVPMVRRVRTADGVPVVYIENYVIPLPGFRDRYAAARPESLLAFLEEHYGLYVTHSHGIVRAEPAEGHLARRLKVPKGEPLLALRQALAAGERPAYFSYSWFVSRLFDYHIFRQRR